MNPVPLLLFLPRTPPPELVRQLHPIATDRNPATANRFPHLGETDLFADECIGSLIPSPSPLSFCVSRGTWRRRGIKIRGIFRGSTFMPDWRTGHVSFYLCCQTRNRVGESYARVGLVKGIRIEIRSIDARLVSFDDSFSFCFSPFAIVPDNFIKRNCACCSNWNGCLLIFWMLASAKRSKSFKIFLSLRVF